MIPELRQLDVVRELLEHVNRRKPSHVEVSGPWGSGKSLVAVQCAKALASSLLFITSGRIESEAAYDDLCTFSDPEKSLIFPAWEVLPTDIMAPADDIVAERMNTLKKLVAIRASGENLCVSIPIRSVMQHVVNRKKLVVESLSMKTGEEYDLEDLVLKLTKLGYNREVMVEQRGELSVRGCIFDIFPISSELPYRIEFFGDEIESIRRFEPETQRSVDKVDELQILPRSEKTMLLNQVEAPGTLDTALEYFPENTLVVIDEPLAVMEEAQKLDQQFGEGPFFISWNEAEKAFEKFHRISIAQVAYEETGGVPRIHNPMSTISSWGGNPDGFWEQLEKWGIEDYSVQLLCNNTGERRRLYELLEERGYRPGNDTFDIRIEIGRLRAGFASTRDKLAVLSEREMFGRKYVRRSRRRFEAGTAITAFSDLKVGDYIVHIEHGIGRYLGLRRFEGRSGDFLTIKYAGGDILYLPVTHIDHIQKYIGGGGIVAKVDKLGGATWARKKARVKKAVRDMTEELLKLYARRESQDGHSFPTDTQWQVEFDDAFEYDETPDQARAIIEVKQDMESEKPADRLVCGDVGYGKTEVAMRAAFKTVMDGKQVAVLVPTTVLAQQHYETFRQRMADYPVTIKMLSRFKTDKELRETVEQLKAGQVDIAIGTHRLVSKDVEFKDLGLVIIDEEQRFGVKHKERLKEMKTSVDVITMTATPIPRTLQFSLIGVRDMSIINTAPNDRLPIHTCIEVFDKNLIREAIEREIGRQGQTFYLHNRVQTIINVAAKISELVPSARVAIGHGQMPKHDLENVMTAFVRGEIDVLVCTTIIGSGLDIPNANTIIVDRADCFGLSELYQLRGRVGRYKHRAFAYLLVPGDKALTEDAQKRLKALEEFSTLGAGFRIAMRDLEIRGCGNILGGQQSGHISTVGYDAYTQLIAETVSELKGEPVKKSVLPTFDLSIDAHIPEQYIQSTTQKITMYKRISGISSINEAEEMIEELTDRFGKPPGPIRRLINIMKLRAQASDLGIKKMAASKDAVSIEFETGHFLNRRARSELELAYGDRLQFIWKDRPTAKLTIPLDTSIEPVKHAEQLLQSLTKY